MGGGDGYKSVAYFANSAIYGRNHQPQDIPADKLTHVLYSFANVRPDSGEVYLTDSGSDTDKHSFSAEKEESQAKDPSVHWRLDVFLNFSQPASTDAGRAKFADSAVRLVKDLGLDGLDIDWEYPLDDAQAANYVLLPQKVRESLDYFGAEVNARFDLTIACPAGP
ncbi:MAG: hypothetical protein M1835_006431 [Candelina submexicana]|nr:MAG: hypothetical protein M1835_006431 [Candelina submexicana]